MAKCPINKLRDETLAEGLISDDEYEEMNAKMNQIVENAVRFAEESPFPSPEEALEDVFVSLRASETNNH